ncbi:hypothetical protein [Bowmanella pacifica]|uniref:Uncharacterized protein n=1 Tax=Bowmanella pacifica TaxID=502051 RepID=A0A917YYT1_9ALTE|nr:hypothetical protein [Bowmanella pacifica]GGO70113.1 hypothetical protein GCM10010982_22850 [Bowmanella pacifica]
MKAKHAIYALLLIVTHSFFSCVASPFHVPDPEHPGYSHLSHLEAPDYHQNNSDDSGPDHQHQLHVHLSCHSGYGSDIHFSPCVSVNAGHPARHYLNLFYQPPVPPPDLSL